MTWRAQADRDFGRALLRIVNEQSDDTLAIVTSMQLQTIKNDAYRPDLGPVLRGNDAVAFMQAIMDAAYEYGLRPSGQQDERHLKEHLKDMQAITRHVLKMEKTNGSRTR